MLASTNIVPLVFGQRVLRHAAQEFSFWLHEDRSCNELHVGFLIDTCCPRTAAAAHHDEWSCLQPGCSLSHFLVGVQLDFDYRHACVACFCLRPATNGMSVLCCKCQNDLMNVNCVRYECMSMVLHTHGRTFAIQDVGADVLAP